jgi:Kef-type K+ transport system membrane component KefB
MFVVVMLVSGNQPLAGQVLQTLLIVAIFVPFSYFLDGILWRSYQRRMARHHEAGGRRSS